MENKKNNDAGKAALIDRWGDGVEQLLSDSRVTLTLDEIQVKLKKPVVTNGNPEPTKVLVIKDEPTALDLRAMDEAGKDNDVSKNMYYLASWLGVPRTEFNKLSASDYMLLQSVGDIFL